MWLGVMNVMIEMNVNLEALNLNQVLRNSFTLEIFVITNHLFVGAKRLARFLGNCRQLRPRVGDSPADRLPCWPHEENHYRAVDCFRDCVHRPGHDVPGNDRTLGIS